VYAGLICYFPLPPILFKGILPHDNNPSVFFLKPSIYIFASVNYYIFMGRDQKPTPTFSTFYPFPPFDDPKLHCLSWQSLYKPYVPFQEPLTRKSSLRFCTQSLYFPPNQLPSPTPQDTPLILMEVSYSSPHFLSDLYFKIRIFSRRNNYPAPVFCYLW